MECRKECTTLATVKLTAIQGLFSLSSFAYGIELSPPFFFSCYQDYRWGSGLSDPCDIHHCGQTECLSFYWRVNTDELWHLFISHYSIFSPWNNKSVLDKIYLFIIFWLSSSEWDRKGSCNHSLVVLVKNKVTQPMKMIFIFRVMWHFKAVSCWIFVFQLANCIFYLAPHNRLAHYIILHDNIFNGNMEKYGHCQCPFFPTIYWCVFYFRIQEFTFTLCHVYAKATCLVSIPAPVIVSYQFFDDEWTSTWFVSIDSICNLVLQRQTWLGSN